MRNTFQLIAIFTVLTLIVGCSGNVPLGGTVTFSDDGTPLTIGTVVLERDGRIARGILDENGRFVIGFEREGDGLPPGQYRVAVVGATRAIMVEREPMPGVPPSSTLAGYERFIDPRHESTETSGIVVDVDRTTRTLDIVVDRF